MSSAPFNPLASSAPLIIYIDYKSPYAYLAKDPTYALENELGIEIDWRPFTLDIPSYLGSSRLDREGKLAESNRSNRQWSIVRYNYRDVRRYASLRGLITRGTTKIWNSSLAGIGMLWAKAQGRQILHSYSRIVYERFWKRALDIEDLSVIESALGEAGAQTNGFNTYATGEGRALHDHIQQATFDAGIFGVPTYVIEGEVFFGREHLPRVRWILNRRSGAPPDVAYEHQTAAGIPPIQKVEGRLSVAIDFKSPSAYLAISPICELAEQLGISIDWQPLLLAPRKDRSADTVGNDRGTRHRRIRAEYNERDVIRYAAGRGLVLRGLGRETDSTLAALALLWLRRNAESLTQAYVQIAFARYWRDELDIQNEAAIRALMVEIGAPVDGFSAYARGEGRAELERLQSELVGAGLFEVPTYLLNGEIFVGRQHLPLIRALLSGKGD